VTATPHFLTEDPRPAEEKLPGNGAYVPLGADLPSEWDGEAAPGAAATRAAWDQRRWPVSAVYFPDKRDEWCRRRGMCNRVATVVLIPALRWSVAVDRVYKPGQISVALAEAALECPDALSGALVLPSLEQGAEAVLTAWLHAVYARLRFPSYEPWNTAICVLLQLGIASDAMTVTELADFIRSYAAKISGKDSPGVKCLDCGQVHDLSVVGDFTAPRGHPERDTSPVGMLADFGAVAWADAGPHGLLWLTPLGRCLAISLFFNASPHPTDSVADVIEVIGPVPAPAQRIMMQYWLTGRSAADAVRELLAYGEPLMGFAEEGAARLLAAMVGPDGLDGWRDWAAKPGYGVYARQWMEAAGEPLPDSVTEDQKQRDKLWLIIDEMNRLAEREPGAFLGWFKAIKDKAGDAGVNAIVFAWHLTGHPAVDRFAALLVKAGLASEGVGDHPALG
jgi:hypothetical protein